MGEALRLVACGSVDDGKSTLIGRLLFELGQLRQDEFENLRSDSERFGTRAEGPDFALLLDGLEDERAAGITVDVAYRFFSSPDRDYILLDSPGHEQYTRNMAVAAAGADAAIVLVDARHGLVEQTMRHLWILSIFRISEVALVVNKMDLIGWEREAFERIENDFAQLADQLGFRSVTSIPTCATSGHNLVAPGPATWYAGDTVAAWLEKLKHPRTTENYPFQLPVQLVLRPNEDFRGYCGRLVQGSLRRGDAVVALPSGKISTIDRVLLAGIEADEAVAGDSVCVTLDAEIDVRRGDVLAAPDGAPARAAQFRAQIIWLSEKPLIPGREYLFKLKYATTRATVTSIRSRRDLLKGSPLAAKLLEANDIGDIHVALADRVLFAPYAENKDLGGFILIDRATSATVGAGVIQHELRRDANLTWQSLEVDKKARERLLGHKPCCIWLTGLSGAGKSTIANALESRLHAQGRLTYLLDGDNVRHGLNSDLGFEEADRAENIRRVAEVARLMVDAGLVVIVALISPFSSDRQRARSLFEEGEFIEVHVDASVDVCAARDPKGLYAKAQSGQIPNFTGISSPYEPPAEPELHIDTAVNDLGTSVSALLEIIP